MTLLKVKESGLKIERRGNFLVYTRRQTPDTAFGKWEPISNWGYVVVCPSWKEAFDLVMLVGGRLYPAPSFAINDSAYLKWLLKEHFNVQPNYTVTGKREMMFAEFIRGWVPESEQLIRGDASPLIIHRCLDESKTRNLNADMVENLLMMERPKV